MKIVLFNPLASETMPYDGPPMALLMVASTLQEHDVKIIDWHYDKYWETLEEEWRDADVFGVTALTGYQIKDMMKSVRLARKVNPDLLIVVGGWHATFCPEQILDLPEVDVVVMGQGPDVFKKVIIGDRSGNGLAYREGDKIVIRQPDPPRPLNDFPPLPYHLIDNEQFLTSTKFGNRVAYLLNSQGCPFACGFCSEAAFYKRKWTARPVEETVKEALWFKEKYGIDGIILSDSNFLVGEKRIQEFCKLMIGTGLAWGGTGARPDLMSRFSDETWELLRESNCGGIFIGTESANNETLRIMNKQCVIEQTITCIQMGKKHGVYIECPFIIGFPGTDIERDLDINLQFINDHMDEASQYHMFIYTPFPGTALLAESIKHGYKPPDKLEGWIDYALHTQGILPWVPDRYALLTSQLSVYFHFLSGNVAKVIKVVLPPWLQWPALLVERTITAMARFRIRHRFFSFPIEYKVMDFLVRNRQKFIKKKLVY